MSTQNYMIGVDIGTTSTKAVLFKENGEVVAKAGGEYPPLTPTPLRRSKIRSKSFRLSFPLFKVMTESGIDPAQVLFVSFSAAMHSVIAVDSQGDPLTRRITWADNRSVCLVCEAQKNSAAWSCTLEPELRSIRCHL